MSDQEVPGRHSAPRVEGKRSDARDQLRRELEGMRSAETDSAGTGEGGSKVVRLPRRPRRVTDDADGRPHKTWRSEGDSLSDPPPTRPVLRSELQRETGWWPVDPGPPRPAAPTADPGDADHEATVFDLDVLRRKRAGGDAATVNIRPRRVDNSPGNRSDTDGDRGRSGGPESPPTDGPAGQR